MTPQIRITIDHGPDGDVPFLHVSLGRLATLFSAADAIIAADDVAGLMAAICGAAAREGGEANVAPANEWRDRFAALAFCGDCESAPCCCELEGRAIADQVRATHVDRVDEDDVERLDLEPEDEPGTAALRCPRYDVTDPAGFRYMEDITNYRKLNRFDAAGTLHVDGHFEVGEDGDHPRFLCETCDIELPIPEGLEYEFDRDPPPTSLPTDRAYFADVPLAARERFAGRHRVLRERTSFAVEAESPGTPPFAMDLDASMEADLSHTRAVSDVAEAVDSVGPD